MQKFEEYTNHFDRTTKIKYYTCKVVQLNKETNIPREAINICKKAIKLCQKTEPQFHKRLNETLFETYYLLNEYEEAEAQFAPHAKITNHPSFRLISLYADTLFRNKKYDKCKRYITDVLNYNTCILPERIIFELYLISCNALCKTNSLCESINKFQCAVDYFIKLELHTCNSSYIEDISSSLHCLLLSKPVSEKFIQYLKEHVLSCEVFQGYVAQILHYIGINLCKANKFDEALEYLQDAREQKYDPSLLSLGVVYFNKKEYEKAILCCDEYIEKYVRSTKKDIAANVIEARINKCQFLNKLKQFGKVIECCDSLLDIDPLKDDYRYSVKLIKAATFLQQGKIDEANRVIELSKLVNIAGGLSCQDILNTVQILVNLNEHDKAIRIIDASHKHQENKNDQHKLLIKKATILLSQDRWSTAKEVLECITLQQSEINQQNQAKRDEIFNIIRVHQAQFNKTMASNLPSMPNYISEIIDNTGKEVSPSILRSIIKSTKKAAIKATKPVFHAAKKLEWHFKENKIISENNVIQVERNSKFKLKEIVNSSYILQFLSLFIINWSIVINKN